MKYGVFILYFSVLAVFGFFFIFPVFAGMSSVHFQINWDAVGQSGNENAVSESFSLHDSLGGLYVGTSTSANFQTNAGYRSPEGADNMSLTVRSQNGAVKTAYSAFNRAGKSVTVSSASGFSTGNYIAVIENEGFQQFVAVGKITNIVGSVLTVDVWDGAVYVMSAAPADGKDFVYLLSATTVPFGSISVGAQNTSVNMMSVVSGAQTGYTVYVQTNHSLQDDSGDIMTGVADGAVSLGSEEYGASVTGTTAAVPDTDLAVTTTRAIQSRATISSAPADRTEMTFKLSIILSTKPGDYSQNVAYTLTANY